MATLATGNVPVFSSIPISSTRVNNPYNYVVTASANPAPTFSMTGAPAGVVISSGGVISGTPTAQGVYAVDITASNVDGSAHQTFSLTVGSVPTLTGTPVLTTPINTLYFVSFGVTGFPAPTVAFSGPSWLQQSGSNFSGYSSAQGVSQIMVTATNQFGTATESWNLNVVGQSPIVMGTPPNTATVGSPYTYSFAAVGTNPLVWSISGGPSWLTIDSNGVVSGNPDITGSYPNIVVTISNSGGSNSTSFSLTVAGVAPSITGTPLTTGTINTSYSFPITVTGQPFPIVSISGGPAWLTVNGGVVSGIPNVPGHYANVVITANSSTGSSQLTYTLDVSGVVPFLAGGSLPVATAGQAYNYSFPRNGIPLGTCSFSGAPSWLSMDSATCTISGTPTTSAPTVTFSVTQTNSQGSDTKSYTLYVQGNTVCSPPMGIVDNSYSYTCTSTSQPPPTFTLSNAPPGITMSSTGVFSGTPTTPGQYPMTVTITNSEETLVLSTPVIVYGNVAPVFISTPPAVAAANQMFSYQMAALGRPDIVYSIVSGPSWLHIVDGDFLEGMPLDSDEGSIVVVLRASNGINPDALQQFVLSVEPPLNPIIKSVCPGVASVGRPYTCNLYATGATPISFLIGSAPDWLMIDGCCTLKGTPDMSDVGGSSIILTASNGYLPNDIQNFNIMVSVPPSSQPTSAPTMRPTTAPTTTAAPVITSLPSTSVTIGDVYFYPVNVTGQPAPVLTVSDLPSWLRLVGNILTGTPPPGTAGTVTVSLTATNGAGPSAVQTFVLAIANPPTAPHFISTAPSQGATVGSLYNYPAVVAVGTPTPNYTYSGPSFLSLVTTGGVTSLKGTPPTGSEGTYTILLVAANGVVPPDSQSFSLTVAPMATLQPTAAPTASPVMAHFTSTPPVSAISNSPFIYVVTATGSPAPTFNVSGLPSWLSFTGGNTISGSPPVGMTGSSTFKVIALQGGVPTAEQYVTVLINANGNAPTITSTPPLTGQLGSVYTYVVRATGNPAPVFLWTIPSWLSSTITPTGDIISGVPNVPGDYSITVVASNGVSPAATQTFNISIISVPTTPPTSAPTSANNGVASAPLIISSPPATAVTGSTFQYHIVALGSPTPFITTTQLPSWLQLVGCCDITGTVPQGTGSVLFTITANNGVAPSASQTVSLSLQSPPAPKIISTPVTTVRAGSLYQYTINVQGNPVPLITSSTLPSWLRLMGNILIGTPPRGTQGIVPITLTASNGVSPNDVQQFSITVQEQLSSPLFTSLPPLIVNNGSLFTYTITTSGNPSPSVSAVVLPTWLTLTGNTLSGNAPQQGGRFDVVLQAANGNLPNAQQSFTIQVQSKPYLDLSNAPTTASVGYVYMYTVATTSPTSNYTMVTNATWLGLNGARITGSPPAGSNGTFCYTIIATNSMGSDSASACFQIVAAASCATTLSALNAELQYLLANTRAKCQPEAAPAAYPNTTCHYQCDHPVVVVNDLTLGVAAGRRLLARMLLSLSPAEQSAISASAANQWGLSGSSVHTMSSSNVPDVRLIALTPTPLATLSSVNNAPVIASSQGAASQTDLLGLIQDVVPQFSAAGSSVVTVERTEPAWYTYLIIMLLVATAICWIIFLVFAFRKRKEEPEKLPLVERARSEKSLEDEEIRAARLDLEAYHRDLENLQAMHEQARAEALRREQVGQFEQAEVSRLLKQMVELEATQQQQHAQQVAGLNAEIAALRAKAAGAHDARQGDRLAQAQQHEELKRLNEEYRKLKSDRALLQADDLKNQKKLLDTVENLTRALEKSRADSEEMKAAIEEERRRRIAAENARAERERQDQVTREQERLLEEKARLLREQAERDRLKERDRADQERLQKEKDRLEAERQRLAASREQMREQEKLDAIAREREALEAERRRLEAERLRTEKERLEKEQRAEKERLAADKAALEAERARLTQERQKKEEERKKKELDAERTRLEQEKEKLMRDREMLQRQQEERTRARSPTTLDANGFSEDSGFEDDSGGSDTEPQPLRFPKGPGLQDSDEEDGAKFKTLSRAQQGVLEQWKQREKAAADLKAREKRRAARRLARRKARHEARREARAAERAKAAEAQ